jgi:P-type conjugative transfer protein TrbJ
MPRTVRALVLGALALLLINPFQVFGILGVGDIVYDPANHAENLLQTAEAIIHTANQVTQIEHQVTQLWYEAQNLTSLEGILGFLQSCGLAVRGQSLALHLPFSCHAVLSAFRGTYGPAWTSGEIPFGEHLTTWNTVAYNAAEDAARAQGLNDQLTHDLLQLDATLAQSDTAIGNLAAIQANSRILALNTQNALRQQEVDIINSRMAATRQAMQASSTMHMQFVGLAMAEGWEVWTRTAVGLPSFR